MKYELFGLKMEKTMMVNIDNEVIMYLTRQTPPGKTGGSSDLMRGTVSRKGLSYGKEESVWKKEWKER